MFGTYTPQVRVTSGLYLLIDYHTCLLDPLQVYRHIQVKCVCNSHTGCQSMCKRQTCHPGFPPIRGGDIPSPKGAYGIYSKNTSLPQRGLWFLFKVFTKNTDQRYVVAQVWLLWNVETKLTRFNGIKYFTYIHMARQYTSYTLLIILYIAP